MTIKTMKCLVGTVFTIIIISNMQFSYAQLHLCDSPFVDKLLPKWLDEIRICFEDQDKIFELDQNVTIHMYAETTEPAEWIRVHFFHSSQTGFFEKDGAERQFVKEARIKESPHIINLQDNERIFGTDLEDAIHFTINCNDPPCKKPYEQERVFQFSFPGTYYYEITMQTPDAENIYSYYPGIEVFKVLDHDELLAMKANDAILTESKAIASELAKLSGRITISNATNLFAISIALLIASVAIIAAIGTVYYSKKHFEIEKESSKKAFNPLITPRVGIENGIPILQLWNIGNGSAINVELELLDADSNEHLSPVRMFAFRKDEFRNTGISFVDHPRIRINGTYDNIVKEKILIDIVADHDELRAYHEDNPEGN